jgi:hypothetical protein
MGQVLKFPFPAGTVPASPSETIAARVEHQLQAMVRELEMTLILNEIEGQRQGRLKEAGVLMTEARLVLRHVRVSNEEMPQVHDSLMPSDSPL